MSNVQLLVNKIDDISANCRYLHEFSNARMLLFTETWLSDLHMDTRVSIDGFKLLHGDRIVHNLEEA